MKSLWSWLQAADIKALHFLHGLRIPLPLHFPLVVFVRIGDGWMWIAITAWLYHVMAWPSFRLVVVECLLAVGLSLLAYWPIKLLVRRRRPYDAHGGVTRKVPPLDKYSFPSGHTMNNLAVALTLASQLPALYAPAIGIPLALGVLRVVFGVHFLSDILGGAVLGAMSHLAAKYFMPYLPFWNL